MRIFLILLLSISSLLLHSFCSQQDTENSFPKAIGWVNDFENILSDEEEGILNQLIIQHEKESTNEIAIVTLSSYEDYKDLESYSFALAKSWGVGKKDKNNGVLIAVSKTHRDIYIQNGTGIEPLLTNEETKLIIDTNIIPHLKKGNYYRGLKEGLEEIMKEIE